MEGRKGGLRAVGRTRVSWLDEGERRERNRRVDKVDKRKKEEIKESRMHK